MTANSEIISLLLILHARGLGRVKSSQLIAAYGSAEKVVQAGWEPKKRLLFGKWTVDEWEKDLEMTEKQKVNLLPYTHPFYPKNLLQCPGYPLLLYIKGKLLPGDSLSLAIVGTRQATLYGKQSAEKIAQETAQKGVTVVSGLARGIDTSVHEGALKGGGRTLAVIGSGLINIYPPENRLLSEKIVDSGALLSEFPMCTSPAKWLFPQRNRTVSGLTLGVCLIESPLEGGAMITMRCAEQQHKLLFALPGRVDWPTFEGNHFLLKHKKAQLVTNGGDLLKELNISPTQAFTCQLPDNLSAEETAFLAKLPNEEKSIEELVLLTQLSMMQLNVLLTRLVLKKVVKVFPGKIYKKNF
jgi:DNA processing protein